MLLSTYFHYDSLLYPNIAKTRVKAGCNFMSSRTNIIEVFDNFFHCKKGSQGANKSVPQFSSLRIFFQ